jgi:hypothetical protein
MNPEVLATDALSTPRWPIFHEDWQGAVRSYGEERAKQRSRDGSAAYRVRGEGFADTAAEVERFLDRGTVNEMDWNRAASVAPWQAARAALLDDPDAPLPPV